MNSSTDELRGRIISVATELFQKTGLKFTMQEVAASLSISKKTIYTVYPSKEALLLDMIDGLFADIHRKKAELAAQDAPVEERIRKVIVALPEHEKARFIKVEWEDLKAGKSYNTDICIVGTDRKGMLSDISRVCEDMDIHLSGVNAKSGRDGSLTMTITLSISSTQEMQKVQRSLRNIEGVLQVYRAKS